MPGKFLKPSGSLTILSYYVHTKINKLLPTDQFQCSEDKAEEPTEICVERFYEKTLNCRLPWSRVKSWPNICDFKNMTKRMDFLASTRGWH